MLDASKPLRLPPKNENKKHERKIGKKIVVFFLTFLMLVVIFSSIGYLAYFITEYGKYPYYTNSTGTLILSEEYIGRRDSLTAFGILSILVLGLSILYLGILNYLKD
jgi:hypothetical protein